VDNRIVRILPALLASTLLLPLAVRADDDPPAAPQPAPRFEGALGPVVHMSPDYLGGGHLSTGVTLGFFLRYGRLSVSNAGEFVTRRRDDVFRGLGADVHLSDTVRTNFGLRLDRGRDTSHTEALRGLNDVRTTIRARLSTTWAPRGRDLLAGWHTDVSLSTDLLGRGGGQTLDLGVGRNVGLTPRIVWSYGLNVSAGSSRYMQSYFGVTPEESLRSGYPVYTPGAGLRDVSLGTTFRMEIDPKWVAFWGGSVAHLLGPAARSPLSKRSNSVGLNAGIARRF
jgi:outer membrane scaffolding protein for murein synthesis (MipA/OmpV family)